MTSTDDPFITPAQAAKILGISHHTVRKLCDKRILSHYRPTGVGGPYKIRKSVVEQHLQDSLIEAGTGSEISGDAKNLFGM